MRELSLPHTDLLRLGLAVERSVLYWTKATEEAPLKEIRQRAWEENWFGSLSRARCNYLVGCLEKRFPYSARKLLGFQARQDSQSDRLICHWHLQLNDPIYRTFTCDFLLCRWALPDQSLSLDDCLKWVDSKSFAKDWQANTRRRMASGLLSAAGEAGLCTEGRRQQRGLKLPQVKKTDYDYLIELLSLASAKSPLSHYLSALGTEQLSDCGIAL